MGIRYCKITKIRHKERRLRVLCITSNPPCNGMVLSKSCPRNQRYLHPLGIYQWVLVVWPYAQRYQRCQFTKQLDIENVAFWHRPDFFDELPDRLVSLRDVVRCIQRVYQGEKLSSPRIILSMVLAGRSGMSGITLSALGRRSLDFVASTPSRRT